jgi:hypothetical protein
MVMVFIEPKYYVHNKGGSQFSSVFLCYISVCKLLHNDVLKFCTAKRWYGTTTQVCAVKWRKTQTDQSKIEVFAVAKIRNI